MSKIISELCKFDIENIYSASKIIVDNFEQLDILVHFKCRNPNNDSGYTKQYLFKGCRCEDESGIDILKILDINNLSMENISSYGWENLKWLIIDVDDDGGILFKFYCASVTEV